MKFPNVSIPVLTLLIFISTSLQFETKDRRERKFDGIVSVLKKYLDAYGDDTFVKENIENRAADNQNDLYQRCGVPAIQPNLDKRIVGGEPAAAHAWPWQVRVQHRRSATRWGDTCGGTIISREYVLTAAHCVYDKPGGRFREEDIRVVAGDDDRSVDKTDGSIQVMTVSKIFIQDRYEFDTDLNDIAILRLTNQLTFNNNVSRCCLATSEPTLESFCYATGWGDTRGTGDRSKLYQVRLPIIAQQTCKKSSYYGRKIKESMMCAGYEKGGRDTCQGDSGGPLVCQHGDRWDLHGITSWGEGCAEPRKPGVYTKVHLFLDWIKEITGVSPPLN